MNKKFIVIAGNIGAGKTTLACKLANHLRFDVFQEPFKLNPYLENFYKDMKSWAFQSQMSFLAHSFRDHLDINGLERPVIQDRSLYENAEVFARHLHEAGMINDDDWQTYQSFYHSILRLIAPPDLVIYLQSSTDRCVQNIRGRQRNIERDVDPQYIDNLNKLYTEWHDSYQLSPKIVAVADEHDYKNNDDHFRELVNQIKVYLR
jgi:deoxyadenosine/deoxycytidine kinase